MLMKGAFTVSTDEFKLLTGNGDGVVLISKTEILYT